MGGIFIEQLSISQKRSIVGGKAPSGALINGISSLVKNVSEFFVNSIGAISTSIFAAKSLGKVDKLEYKIGTSTFKVDNTTSNKLNIEKESKKENSVVPTPPPVIIDLF